MTHRLGSPTSTAAGTASRVPGLPGASASRVLIAYRDAK
jgi:hypothetical protein